jgi:hypothetical protein
MTNDSTFREIEEWKSITIPPTIDTSSLALWYDTVRDTPISGLSDKDLCIASRQGLYLEFIVPQAIRRLKDDVLAGDMYDGELFAALCGISPQYWSNHASDAQAFQEIVDLARTCDDSDTRQLAWRREARSTAGRN